MGMYNDYYKKYYANMGQQSASKAYMPRGYNGNAKVDSHNNGAGIFPIFLNVFGRGYINIFIGQCIVTLVLFGGLILYRAYPGTDLGRVYALGLDYMSKGIKVEEFSKEQVVAVFNEVKSVLNFNEQKEAYISENYLYPVTDKGESSFAVEDNMLVIKATEGTDVRASYPGKVKSVKDSSVTVNYGEGIEMVYNGLTNITALEGMTLDSNDVLGKVGNVEKGAVSIEILYMGDRLNPFNCFELNKTL